MKPLICDIFLIVECLSQSITFVWFSLTVLFLLSRGDQGSPEIVSYGPRSTCLQRFPAHLVNMFVVDFVCFYPGQITFL